ncbi:zinc finger protein 569-like isoform X4 [Colias croceus]|uniref:zinc finger protein 569-like isoform X4 n=1 Tax=Colias crocea TaxID=72248 RepID=UPI001E27B586|nr:zinc finger protein 569-like isoform X4 [Colias croceus]
MEFDNIIVKENPGLCRCCLSEGCYKELGTEYPWMDETEVYADMLLECFDISISQHIEGPNGTNRLICEVCITRLRDACNFKKQVMDCEKKFVDMIGRGEFKKVLPIEGPDMKSELNLEEDTDVVTEIEYLEEGIDFDDDKDDPTQDITVEPLPVKPKRGRPKKSSTKVEKKAKEEKPRTSKTTSKGPNTDPTGDRQKKKEMVRKLLIKRRNIEYVLQYSNATPFLYYKARYRCFYCTEPMKDPDMLREHTLKMHQFANLELVIHDRTKNNRNWDAAVKIDICNLACKLCPQIFNDLEQLIHHLIIAHDAEYDMSVPNCLLPFRLKKDHLTCPICDTKFVSFEYLLRHANKYHLSHDYICDVCGTSFQGVNHLRMHNRYYHKEGGYTCDYCGIKLETLSKKMLHEKNIHLVNLLTCPYCPEIFKSPYFKKLHLANVHGLADLKIKCPYCPKVFLQEGIMSRHMRRVHLRERNVECPICGDKFFGQYDVKLHMVKHNGDKKFICSVCGKMFGKRSNLNKHIYLHTGRKDYNCCLCGKEFAYRSNLRFHYKKKHPQYIEEESPVIDDNVFVNIELGTDFDVVEETV